MQPGSGWPGSPRITADELPAVLAEHALVVVHCWALWNGYDKLMDSVLQDLRRVYADQLEFFAMDFDLECNSSFFGVHHVLNVPSLVCFSNGVHHEILIGNLPGEVLMAKFDPWLTAADSGAAWNSGEEDE